VYKHALRNAMVPVLTVVGLQFGALLAGRDCDRNNFFLAGNRTPDHPGHRQPRLLPVQGCILMIGLTYVMVNFMTDFFYSLANQESGSESTTEAQRQLLFTAEGAKTRRKSAQQGPALIQGSSLIND